MSTGTETGEGSYAEGVLWNILTAPPLLVSQAQLDEFTALFPNGDARELQPLDGRAVYLVPEPSSWAIATIGLGLAAVMYRRRWQPG